MNLVGEFYEGNLEKIGSNWIRVRWHNPDHVWRRLLDSPVQKVRAFEAGSAAFSDAELGTALLAILDEKRPS